MAIRIIYRSYGGENRKGRPEYYGKLLALTSFLRAFERVDGDVVYLNDGPIPHDRLRLMQETGRIIELPGIGMRGSYRAALELPASEGWPDDDVAWFSEDDYLYHPDSLRLLHRITETVAAADYFSVYGSTPTRPAKRPDEPVAHRPSGWIDLPPWEVDGQRWVRAYSSTSTFGARVGALRQDMAIFRFCMLPHRTMLRDHDTGLVLQGYEPHSYRELGRALMGMSVGSPRRRARRMALAPFLLATNLRAHRRPGRRRMLLVADPNLATHMEAGLESPGRDWAVVAGDVEMWARSRGWHWGDRPAVPTPVPGDA